MRELGVLGLSERCKRGIAKLNFDEAPKGCLEYGERRKERRKRLRYLLLKHGLAD